MKISVVIPCHNAESYIAQAIGSVLEQTRPAHEIVVVDDGSTDASLSEVLRFAARRQCRVFSQPSGQAARTRNTGAAVASGDALMFLDADDVLAPETLHGLAGALQQRPGSLAICPWYRLALVDGHWIREPPSCAPRRPGQDPLDAWLTGWYHPPCAVLWSREAFERAGRWDERWNPNDDGDLVMRALVYGIPLVEARNGAGYYRRQPGDIASLSGARFSRDGLEARMYTLRKITCLLEQRGQVGRYRNAIGEAIRNLADAARDHPAVMGELEAFARRHLHRWLYEPGGRGSPAGRVLRAGRRAVKRTRARWPGSKRTTAAAVEPAEIRYGADETAAPPAAEDISTVRPELFESPSVSVIIPTYNRAGSLPRALRSVLDQTFEDFEVLVVDDGSTDDTPQVIKACGDSRVRYFRQSRNKGVASARNLGLKEARGRFVAFLDSDDQWLPEKLTRQVVLFEKHSRDLGLVYTGVESVFGDGIRRVDLPTLRGDIHRAMLIRNAIHGGGSNVVMRRNVVATVGFFDESFAAIEDYDYWLRITRMFDVDYVAEPLVRYHDDRETSAAADRRSRALRDNIEARWRLYRKHRPSMKRAGVAHRFHLETARRCLAPSCSDLKGARAAAWRAVAASPGSIEAQRMLRRTTLPLRLRRILRRGWQVVHQPSRA